MAALVRGRTVRAARAENTAAIPAGIAVGTTTIGHHIILLPKLAPSWDRYISPAVTAAPTAVTAERLRSNRPVRTSATARRARFWRRMLTTPPWYPGGIAVPSVSPL